VSRLGAAQSLWRRLPLPLRRLAAPLLSGLTQAYVRARRAPGADAARGPIKVVGLFSDSSGIGASARLCVRAFEAMGVPVETVAVRADGLDLSAALETATPATWIFHLNPAEMIAALASLGPDKVVGPRYGFWAWELPKAPARWLADAALVDEVWAPSRYTAQALAGAKAPVRVVPHPLFAEDYAGVDPAPRQAAFQAVCLFDFKSSMARKNPMGAIEAFRRAFGDDPQCQLTLKTQNGALFPDQLEMLRAALPANARLIDAVWPYADVKRLIAGADVLISLHRAEGFGLTPAEALALGTPVLATAFSGVLDFLDDDCAILVPCTLVAVADAQAIYQGQHWAEPDLDVAAAGLIRLRIDQDLRARLIAAGRARVAERLSPEAWFATLPAEIQQAALSDMTRR
jgi:glycosyltransferase involved in cell wall biosynthesis